MSLCARVERSEIRLWRMAKNSCKFVVQQKYENKAKTKPIKANFLEVKPHSKRKNEDFRQIQNILFMQNKANL
jgi:hypothetical protein